MEYANKSKKHDVFDDDIFQDLNKENEELIKYFLNEGINILTKEDDISKLKKLNKSLREKINHLSLLAETEIEPKISSEIIDSLLENGICFGICPGGI